MYPIKNKSAQEMKPNCETYQNGEHAGIEIAIVLLKTLHNP